MIRNSFFVILFLVAVEILVLSVARHPRFKKVFNILPSVFWIYFLPMLFSTLGIIDSKAPILGWITANVLPMSLFLLLVIVDVSAILRLGGVAIGMFFVGSLGIGVGTVISFILVRGFVGTDFWSGFGALSASWSGGSANMIAVKEALSVPDAIFSPMVVVDTVVPYIWMGILIASVCLQSSYDRWNSSDRRKLDALRHNTSSGCEKYGITLSGVLVGLILGGIASIGAQYIAKVLPEIKGIISFYAWTIISVSLLGLGLSFTRVRSLEKLGIERVGYILLYFVLTAIGASASFPILRTALILIAAGFLIVIIHMFFLLAASRLFRIPLFFVVVASQANIGGVASSPVVAAVYEPDLAAVGLLLAILGNIMGTYFGITCGHICSLLASG